MHNKLSSLRRQTFVAMFLALIGPGVNAEPMEPPLACEITRKAWCIMKGMAEIKFVKSTDGRWHRWVLYDGYWKRDVGVILEDVGCESATADTIEVTATRQTIAWDGRTWTRVVIRLRKDRSCELVLMVPAGDPKFRKRVASSLSGHIAVCIQDRRCSDNILSRQIYSLLE